MKFTRLIEQYGNVPVPDSLRKWAAVYQWGFIWGCIKLETRSFPNGYFHFVRPRLCNIFAAPNISSYQMISRRNIRVKVMQLLYMIEATDSPTAFKNPVQELQKQLDKSRELFGTICWNQCPAKSLEEPAFTGRSECQYQNSRQFISMADTGKSFFSESSGSGVAG